MLELKYPGMHSGPAISETRASVVKCITYVIYTLSLTEEELASLQNFGYTVRSGTGKERLGGVTGYVEDGLVIVFSVRPHLLNARLRVEVPEPQ